MQFGSGSDDSWYKCVTHILRQILGKLKTSQATSYQVYWKITVPAVGQLVIPIVPWSSRKHVIVYIVVDQKQNKTKTTKQTKKASSSLAKPHND